MLTGLAWREDRASIIKYPNAVMLIISAVIVFLLIRDIQRTRKEVNEKEKAD